MNAEPARQETEETLGRNAEPVGRQGARDPILRRRRLEVLIGACWGVIVLKTFLVTWLVHRFSMPFDPMWVVGPSVGIAFVATSLYFWMRD